MHLSSMMFRVKLISCGTGGQAPTAPLGTSPEHESAKEKPVLAECIGSCVVWEPMRLRSGSRGGAEQESAKEKPALAECMGSHVVLEAMRLRSGGRGGVPTCKFFVSPALTPQPCLTRKQACFPASPASRGQAWEQAQAHARGQAGVN
jgi:hypothetical protein